MPTHEVGSMFLGTVTTPKRPIAQRTEKGSGGAKKYLSFWSRKLTTQVASAKGVVNVNVPLFLSMNTSFVGDTLPPVNEGVTVTFPLRVVHAIGVIVYVNGEFRNMFAGAGVACHLDG
jgi:hypothetical protein